MADDTPVFDLNKLSDHAGVTPRTVRYYIQQGLLPSPGSPGPGAKYHEGHLLRLQLIRRLQKEHLPLSEIRKQLESMSDDDVGRALQTPSVRSPVVEYVQRVLSEKSELRPSVRHERRPSAREVRQPRPSDAPREQAFEMLSAESRLEPGPPPPAAAERSQWDRVSLTPDIELHVRRPLARSQNKIVEKLLDYARRLLEEDTP